MLRPVIFIGCGGSGEKAVRYVRDAVKRALDQSDWQDGMPESWQFIGLDTLTTQENPTEIPVIPINDFLTLSAEHDTYAALHRSLVASHSGHRGDPELLCGWLPDPDQVRIPIKDGAGQNRAIGRAVGLRSLERTLKPRLTEAFRRAKSGNHELYEVGRFLGVDAALGSETPEPLVVVCSSMAGGTGAGVALDVVDILRRCDPMGKWPTLVLFANDIFDLQDQTMPMAANSLGLVSELLAAYWSEPGEIQSPLSTNNVQDAGVGPHSVFILGKSGYSGADLGSTAEFYQAVGEALSSWITSAIVQEQIHNFINVNWLNVAKANYGGYPFGRNQQFGAVSSFGAAKVTVGRERFAQWAKHQLAKAVLETLRDGHHRLDPSASERDVPEEQLVQALAKKRADMVYRGCPEWDAPPDPEPGCKGASEYFGSDEQLRAKAAQLKQQIKTEVLRAGQEGKASQWRDQLHRSGKRRTEEIERAARTLSAEDHEWCQSMVAATCRAASQVAAVSSLAVANGALTEAAKKLNRAEIAEVRSRASISEKRFREMVDDALARISGEERISAEDPRLDEAVQLVARGVASHWQNLRLLQAVEVMEHAETQVFGVIADALRAAAGQVDDALDSDEVRSWPDHGHVPVHYQPSTVEFPLEHHDTWTKNLDELCAEVAEHSIPSGGRTTDHLRYRLVAGTKLMADEKEIEPLVHRTERKNWIPGQAADVSCDAGTEEITRRVDRWTGDGAFKRFLGEGLRSYLSDTDQHTDKRRVDQTERLARFRRQLGAAKNRSEPLAPIDTDLYGQCHEKPMTLTTVCSQFPFADDHPAASEARAIVGESAYKSGNTDTASVLISQYLGSPVHPMVVRSITGPVSEALATTEEPDARSSSFWMWRRAMRLDGFIPLPRKVLESIIRGFAVARLCGYVTADMDKQMRITAAPTEVEFPWPRLSRLGDQNDVLAALLESFSLTFGMVSGAGFSVYEGFKRLFDLGEPAAQGLIHPDLEQVIELGTLPHPTVADESPKARGATPGERRDAARVYLEANEGWFWDQKTRRDDGRLFHKGAEGRADAGVPTMELADLFLKCYGELHKLLEADGPRGSVV